jgi:hypothetical protein
MRVKEAHPLKATRGVVRADLGRVLTRTMAGMLGPRFSLPIKAAQSRAMHLGECGVSDHDCRKLYGAR